MTPPDELPLWALAVLAVLAWALLALQVFIQSYDDSTQ